MLMACDSPMQALSKACGTSLCSTYKWQVGPWSTCSAACGVGVQNRTITCMLNGQPADSSQCQQLLTTSPPQQQSCYARPCPASSWRLGSWTPCYQGSEHRNVSCVAANGSYLDDRVSPPTLKCLYDRIHSVHPQESRKSECTSFKPCKMTADDAIALRKDPLTASHGIYSLSHVFKRQKCTAAPFDGHLIASYICLA